MSKDNRIKTVKVKSQQNTKRGLTDKELVKKYEAGSFDLKGTLKPLIDSPKN